MLTQKQYNKLILLENRAENTSRKSSRKHDRAENTAMIFIIEAEKETILDLSQETVRVL